MESYDLTEDTYLEQSASEMLRKSKAERLPLEFLQEAEVTSSSSEPGSDLEDQPLVHASREEIAGGATDGRKKKRMKKKKKTPRKSGNGKDSDQEQVCGIVGWRPACLQPLASVYTFVTLVGLSYFMSGMAIKSLFAQVVSIERQFNIDSSQSGLLSSAYHLGYSSTVLLVGHFARVTHIPLAIGLTGIVNGLLVMAPSFLELYAPYKLSEFDDYNISSPTAERHANQNQRYLCTIEPLESSTSFTPNSIFNNSLGNMSAYYENTTAVSIMANTTFFENATAIFDSENRSNMVNTSWKGLHLAAELTQGKDDPLEVGNSEVSPYAYHLLMLSLGLQGAISAVRYGTLPYIYVDDNVLDKTKIGTYLAITFVFAELTGPAGDLMNGVFSNIPVDLSDTNMSPKDPRFVSAWWLGFLLFGGLSILASIPIMLLPRHLVPVERQRQALAQARVSFGGAERILSDAVTYNVQSQQALLDTEGEESDVEESEAEYCQLDQEKHSPNGKKAETSKGSGRKKVTNGKPANEFHEARLCSNMANRESDATLWDMIKDMPKSLIRIFKSPLYALLVIEMTIIYIPLTGIVWPFRVKYIMFEYNVTMAMTNTARGLSSALTHIAGTLLGSILSRRVSTNMGYLRLILLTAFLSWLITPLLIYFGCDNKPVIGLGGHFGQPLGSVVNRSSSCGCDPALNLLSCGSDGITYLSPCHAGCQGVEATVFTNCSHVMSAHQGGQGTVSPGICDVGCFDNFIIFNVLTATQTFIFSVNNMPRHLLALRILEPKDRAFGSAFLHFAPFIASIPAPYIFGKWMESMCLVWSSDHCSLYDRNTTRYLMMGVEVFVSGLTVLTYVAMVIICRHLDRKLHSTLQQQETGISGAEVMQSDDDGGSTDSATDL